LEGVDVNKSTTSEEIITDMLDSYGAHDTETRAEMRAELEVLRNAALEEAAHAVNMESRKRDTNVVAFLQAIRELKR
jgi:hypothetical protein